MVELFTIGEQVEDEDFHGRFPYGFCLGGRLRREWRLRQGAQKNSTYVEMGSWPKVGRQLSQSSGAALRRSVGDS
jgi:hypothetical protein